MLHEVPILDTVRTTTPGDKTLSNNLTHGRFNEAHPTTSYLVPGVWYVLLCTRTYVTFWKGEYLELVCFFFSIINSINSKSTVRTTASYSSTYG